MERLPDDTIEKHADFAELIFQSNQNWKKIAEIIEKMRKGEAGQDDYDNVEMLSKKHIELGEQMEKIARDIGVI